MFTRSERRKQRAWKRPLAASAALLLAAGAGAGFAVAANASGPGGSTTNVNFIAMNPQFKLFTSHAFADNASLSSVVIGGSTTVPYDATTVELAVTATGTDGATLSFAPAGQPAGRDGTMFLSPNTTSENVGVNVGQKDQMTFTVEGGTAKVTAVIVGYSTQVTDGDVSGLDGNTGQVLTDNGNGASWQDLPPSAAYADSSNGTLLIGTPLIIDSVDVPAGNYEVTDTFNTASSEAEITRCAIHTPELTDSAYVTAETNQLSNGSYLGSGTVTVALDTQGGEVSIKCYASINSGASIPHETLIATPVGSWSGSGVTP